MKTGLPLTYHSNTVQLNADSNGHKDQRGSKTQLTAMDNAVANNCSEPEKKSFANSWDATSGILQVATKIWFNFYESYIEEKKKIFSDY